jgi:hypothetical protein
MPANGDSVKEIAAIEFGCVYWKPIAENCECIGKAAGCGWCRLVGNG